MNNIKFLNLYKTFEAIVKDNYEDDKSYAVRNYISKLEHSIVLSEKIRGRKLNVIRELRNGLAHLENVEIDGIYNSSFTITDSTIKTLEEEIELLRNPVLVERIMTKLSDVFYTSSDESLVSIFDRMQKHTYSNIPVLEDGKVVGVFGEHAVFSYIVKNNQFKNDEKITINDLKEYINLDEQKNEYYIFVSRKEKVTSLYDEFTKYQNGKKLGMAFVTQNGSREERLLGVITIYDLANEKK